MDHHEDPKARIQHIGHSCRATGRCHDRGGQFSAVSFLFFLLDILGALLRVHSLFRSLSLSLSSYSSSSLHDIQSQAQLLLEIRRYDALLRRPRIRQELVVEREALCGHMAAQLRTLRDDFQVCCLEPSLGRSPAMPFFFCCFYANLFY